MSEAAPPHSFAASLRLLAPILAGATFNGFASPALSTLMAVQIAASGAPAKAVGAVVASQFIGVIIGCYALPRVVIGLGPVRAFALFMALSAAVTLAIAFAQTTLAWMALRFAGGLCMAAIFMIIESWINQQIAPAYRSRMIAVYVVLAVSAGSLAPLSLNLVDPLSRDLYFGIAFAFALGPLAVYGLSPKPPVFERQASVRLAAVFVISPGGIIACFAHGLINAALSQGIAVYFERAQFGHVMLSIFLSASTLVGVALQMPIGVLADRLGRRYVLLVLSLLVFLAALPLALAGTPSVNFVLVAGVALAALAQPLYSLGTALTNARLQGRDFVSVAGVLLLAWALGSGAGPLIATALMDWFGHPALFVYIAVTAFLLLLAILQRILAREPPGPAPAPPAGPR
jgi:MFS family permease